MLSYRGFFGLLVAGCCLLTSGCASKCCLMGGGPNCTGVLDCCDCGVPDCADCGVPDCGDCGSGCGDTCGKKSMAFQKWKGCGCDWPKLCACTGPDCGPCGGGCPSCGCADPECGCEEPVCGCEAECGCEDACECGDACGKKKGCCFANLFSCFKKKPACGDCCDGCCESECCGDGCQGCDKELYWSEWHNDPPRCCDPCDKCGNWVGPTAPYRAPYAHPYMP